MMVLGAVAVAHRGLAIVVIVIARTMIGMRSSPRMRICMMRSMGVGGTIELMLGTMITHRVGPTFRTRIGAGDHGALVGADIEADHAVIRATRGLLRIRLFSRAYHIVSRPRR